MKLDVQWRPSVAFQRRLGSLKDLPRSRAYAGFRASVLATVRNGYKERMIAGKDGRGRRFADLAPSTLKNKRRKPGPPLMPGGASLQSRFWTTARWAWIEQGGRGMTNIWDLKMGWVDFKSKSGKDVPPFHIEGSGRLPRRDPTGIDPATWAIVKRQWSDFLQRIGK